jgi:predicted porin
MKKSLLALAVLGAFAGVASAQSSVTIFGVVDLSVNKIKNGTADTTSMQSNQLNSNRLGFRGVEDLGGGLGAGFWLEGAMSNQDGATAWNQQRRSTVSLYSQAAGEVRLGRDYTPTFWNTVFFDVNGANGIGEGLNLISLANPLGSPAATFVRANNTVGYFLPGNLGGFYGQAMIAAGQGVDANKYWGLRFGYAAGPFDTAFAYGKTTATPANDLEVWNIGASWNFGVLKLYGWYNEQKFASLKEDVYELSIGVPLGQGEFRASYGSNESKGTFGALNINPNDATMWSLGYVYNLSKRTALYGGYADISNKGASAKSILSGTIQAGLAGHDSKGYNVGVRHSF